VEAREREAGDEVSVTAATQQAVERQRELERRLREAKTEEERVLARQQLRTYRVSLVFTGDEADLVRKVLGNRPAEALLVLCRTYLGQESLGTGGAGAGRAR
jgi:hypothetical protein